MKFWTSALLLLPAMAVAQQTTQLTLPPDATTFRYPPLPHQARIHGVVVFSITHGEIEFVSGHPLLASAAAEHLRRITPQLPPDLKVTYQFRLDVTEPIFRTTTIVVERGNSLGRVFLRLLGMSTKKTVESASCETAITVPASFELDVVSGELNVLVPGAVPCLQVEGSYRVARR